MSSSNWSGGARAGARDTVAAYFENSEDAQSAVNELVDEDFSLNDIGAAVHSRSFGGRQRPDSSSSAATSSSTATSASFPSTRSPRAGEDKGNFPLRSEGNQDLNPAGATSDTEAVSPWGLFTGGGTPFAGASRPGPITGSEIPRDLPRELPSDLAPEGRAARSGPAVRNTASGGSECAYSSSAFETSFTGMGIPSEHARRLSRELRRGGAVVTVKAGAREGVAERILERNHGTIRYESAPSSAEEMREGGGENERVHVFGEIHRVYPGYVPLEDVRERKAS